MSGPPEMRKRPGGNPTARFSTHRPDILYAEFPSVAMPGPILAKHWFRGCELLDVLPAVEGGHA